MKSVRDDKLLREAAQEFFAFAFKARVTNHDDFRKVADKGLRAIGKATFVNTREAEHSLVAVVDRCIKLLGTTASHERDIESAAWSCAAENEGDVGTAVTVFATTVNSLASSNFNYIAPNYVIVFDDGIRALNIGPVGALLSEDIAGEITRGEVLDSSWQVGIGEEPGLEIEGKVFKLTFAPVSWRVDVSASPGNVDEHALWLIDIALGLLRLSYPLNLANLKFSTSQGTIEPNPTIRTDGRARTVVQSSDGVSFGRLITPGFYKITKPLMEHFKTIGFEQRARDIFDGKENTIAERLKQGLGWLTRGRQSRVRSERFLFYFTAIEALLSDKQGPVTDTIARHAATILVEDPAGRYDLADKIRKHYSTRSKLVHRGERGVSDSMANDLQSIAENLFWSVLKKVPLDAHYQSFQDDLKKAGYGTPWP
jgi:hypothetical protein